MAEVQQAPQAATMLSDAGRVNMVDGERMPQYGDPVERWRQIATVWSAMLGVHVSAHTAALMMAAVKLVRCQYNPHHKDNYIDMVGYADIAERIADKG